MRTIKKTVYLYSELSDQAKARVRDKLRNCEISYGWHESVYDCAVNAAEVIGIDLGPRRKPSIMFSGFGSQGDGASFAGNYYYAGESSVENIAREYPQDQELQRIAHELNEMQIKYSCGLRAQITQSGSYSHSGTMSADIEYINDDCTEITYDDEENLIRLFRDFADWIYAMLGREYDYLTSDEVIVESIVTNECEFDEDGNAT